MRGQSAVRLSVHAAAARPAVFSNYAVSRRAPAGGAGGSKTKTLAPEGARVFGRAARGWEGLGAPPGTESQFARPGSVPIESPFFQTLASSCGAGSAVRSLSGSACDRDIPTSSARGRDASRESSSGLGPGGSSNAAGRASGGTCLKKNGSTGGAGSRRVSRKVGPKSDP